MKNFVSKVFRWWQLPLLAPLLGVVFALMLVVPAWAAVVTNIDIPINLTGENGCNGALLNLNGVEHIVATVTTPTNGGGFNIGVHTNAQLTGTDNLGNSYVANEEFNFTLNNAQPGETRTQNQTLRLISTNSAVNNLQHFILHITVNANGTVTAFVDTFTDTCVG